MLTGVVECTNRLLSQMHARPGFLRKHQGSTGSHKVSKREGNRCSKQMGETTESDEGREVKKTGPAVLWWWFMCGPLDWLHHLGVKMGWCHGLKVLV